MNKTVRQEKKKGEFIRYIQTMVMYSHRFRISYSGLLVITLGLELINAVSAYFSAEIVDFVNVNRDMNKVLILAAAIILVYAVCSMISLLRSYISSKVNCNLEYGVREDFLDIVQQSSYLSALSKESTEIYYRMFTDIGSMVMYYIALRIDIPTAIVSLVVCIGLMFYWSPFMAMMVVFFSVFQVFITNIIKKPISKSTREMLEAENRFVKLIGDIITGVENVKILGMEKENSQKVELLSRSIKRKKVDNTVIVTRLSAIISLLGQFGAVAMLIFGCYLIINERLTIGQYMGFMAVISMFSGSIDVLVKFVFDFEKIRVSFDRYIEFYEEYNSYEYGGSEEFSFCEKFVLENISFEYVEGNPVLDNISVSFSKGEMVGIVGESGSGKSTLGKIIMRLIKPQSGRIIIDNSDITKIKYTEYKKNVCYMSQIPYIFQGTIYENLIMGGLPIDDQKYYEHVLEITGVSSIIEKLDNGCNTVVGKGGSLLSVGEVQRISMARLLIRKPQIIILDEPTSSLNRKYDELIVDIFSKYAKEQNALVLLITHKESAIKLLKKVYRIVDGKLLINN